MCLCLCLCVFVYVCNPAGVSWMGMNVYIFMHVFSMCFSQACECHVYHCINEKWEKNKTKHQVVCRFLQSPQCLVRYHRQVFAVRFTPRCTSIHLVWYAPCCCSIHLFLEETPQLGSSSSPYSCLNTWCRAEPVPREKSVRLGDTLKMTDWENIGCNFVWSDCV